MSLTLQILLGYADDQTKATFLFLNNYLNKPTHILYALEFLSFIAERQVTLPLNYKKLKKKNKNKKYEIYS